MIYSLSERMVSVSDIRSVLKNNLILYAKDRQISQKELSERLGVTQSAVSHWFKGDNSPNIEVVARVSEILSVPISVLLSKPGEALPTQKYNSLKDSPVVEKSTSLSDEAKKVAERYTKLDRFGKAAVQAVMGEEEARIKEQKEDSKWSE